MTFEPALGHALLAVVALDRIAEMVASSANVRRLVTRGGVVARGDGTTSLVVFHVLWFAAVLSENLFLDARPFASPAALALLGIVTLVAAMRGWVLWTLGRRFTIRVVVVPGEQPIDRGPYRFLRHPNYLVVVAELLFLPLLLGAWRTAIVGSLLHLPLLRRRIRCEEAAWRAIGARP